MEALIDQFTFLSDQAHQDKNFHPSRIEDLMKLFEVESYKAWAAMELEQEKELQEAEIHMKETEDYLDKTMESAMEEFRNFEEEMDRMAKAEHDGFMNVAESARMMGNSMEKAATVATKKYVEAAVNSASASMKTSMKALSSNSKKVHPS